MSTILSVLLMLVVSLVVAKSSDDEKINNTAMCEERLGRGMILLCRGARLHLINRRSVGNDLRDNDPNSIMSPEQDRIEAEMLRKLDDAEREQLESRQRRVLQTCCSSPCTLNDLLKYCM